MDVPQEFLVPAIEFERASQNLRLIGGDELIKLIFDDYEDFDPRYRMLLSLKRVYVVAPTGGEDFRSTPNQRSE